MISLRLERLTRDLEYAASPSWVWLDDLDNRPELAGSAHVLRKAQEAGAAGAYLISTSPEGFDLPPQIAAFLFEANDILGAQAIRRKLWNLGHAPFLICVLPSEVRIYAGFKFSRDVDEYIAKSPISLVAELLSAYNAHKIDSGEVWVTERAHVQVDGRVDVRLLQDLEELGRYLIDTERLDPETAHSLIGKYIYITYLRDRGILSQRWFEESGIDPANIWSRNAKRSELRRLVELLEERFNGRVFPLELSGRRAPSERAVALTAGVFQGDSVSQLSLDFQVYDFSFIPIEMLSSIYESFLRQQSNDASEVGAVYTPEFLASYLLAELNAAKPLKLGMRVLDPCCGSGVFLVLVYRRLIETHLKGTGGRVRASELRDILKNSIFGIERNADACYVAEFSLLLTLLSYLDPPDLHRQRFRFPTLHGRNIRHADTFDELASASPNERFDWVVGNPPFAVKNSEREEHLNRWLRDGPGDRVARKQVAEAFAWRSSGLLTDDGCAALIIPAQSLTNDLSARFRKAFFAEHDVLRVTNFANLIYVLFDGRARAPVATITFKKAMLRAVSKLPIVHYGPKAADQITISSTTAGRRRAWALTVFSDDVQTIDYAKIANGDAVPWKLALWGSERDGAALRAIRSMYPTTLAEFANARGWELRAGVRLRKKGDRGAIPCPGLHRYSKKLDNNAFQRSGARVGIPDYLLKKLSPDENHVDARAGSAGVVVARAPHMIIGPQYAAFSEKPFVIIKSVVGVSASPEDEDLLRALSVFFNSSIAQFVLFFLTSSWGVERTLVMKSDVEALPVPALTPKQVAALSEVHRALEAVELEYIETGDVDRLEMQWLIDAAVRDVVEIPDDIRVTCEDFVNATLQLLHGKTDTSATKPALANHLEEYADVLQNQLEEFAGFDHSVRVDRFARYIVCRIAPQDALNSVDLDSGSRLRDVDQLWDAARQQNAQWSYVQRSVRMFDGDQVVMLKPNRRSYWLRSQALRDADDVINEILSHVFQ